MMATITAPLHRIGSAIPACLGVGRRRSRCWTSPWRTIVAALLILPLTFASPLQAEDDKPYDKQLLRLAEILGAVHYLRALCGADEHQVWRFEMQKLIRSEGTSTLRKVRLTQRFNKGYRSYQRTYRSCTPSAETAVGQFIKKAVIITEALVKKYGDKPTEAEATPGSDTAAGTADGTAAEPAN